MDIAIHIGQAKTGSTTIQRWLGANAAALDGFGWRYLKTGRLLGPFHRPGVSDWGHGQIHTALFARRYGLPPRPAPLGVLTNEMLAEIDRYDGLGVLLSMESLYHTEASKVGSVVEPFQRDGHMVRLVVYVRRQAEQLESLYRQQVKASSLSGTFVDWLERQRPDDLSRLEALGGLLRPSDSIVARTFSKSALVRGDLIEDLVESVMGREAPSDAVPVAVSNLSLDDESVALKVALNSYLDPRSAASLGLALARWCRRRGQPNRSLFTEESYHAFQDPLHDQNEQLITRWGLDDSLIADPPPRFSDGPVRIAAARARDLIEDLGGSEPAALGLIDHALPADHPFRPVRRFVMSAAGSVRP